MCAIGVAGEPFVRVGMLLQEAVAQLSLIVKHPHHGDLAK